MNTPNKQKPTRYFSNRQEKRVAKVIGGKQVVNSGATAFQKGDISTDDWLLECKTKTKPSESIVIHKEWLEKNEEEAFAMGKNHSALCFNFGDLHFPKNYYIISETDFKKLLGMEE